MLPGVLASMDRHYASMLELGALTQALLRRAWSRVDSGAIATSWDRATATILETFVNYQILAATAGAQSTEDALLEQGIRATPEGRVRPEGFAGWASDGRPLESLLEQPGRIAQQLVDEGMPASQALDAGRASVDRIAKTQIADAARVSAGVGIAARRDVGWVRMLNPPSCSRCAVLAGRFYEWNTGFDRHPQDDCVHVATSREAARREGLIDDPKTYFNSLSKAEQNRVFTEAGAQAIRDGADMGQVVNARRGMSTAARDEFGNRVGRLSPTSVFGQDVFTTLEGTTTRGLAGQRLIAEGARLSGESAETVMRRSRSGDVSRTVTRQRVQIPRLMPETIYSLAKDRADALRLLRRFGYVI